MGSETPRVEAVCQQSDSAEILANRLTNLGRELERELTAANLALKEAREKVKELDSVIDEECVAVSCINAAEDLRNAIRALKARAEKFDALCKALKGHDGDTDGYEFGLGRVKFENGAPVSFLWAGQAEIDAAINAAIRSLP